MPRSISWIDPAELSSMLREASKPTFAPAGAVPADVPPYEVQGLTEEARIDHFLDWLTRRTGATRLFVADADGLPLARRGVKEALLTSVAVLKTPLGALTTKKRAALTLGAGQVLHLVVADTRWGSFSAGFTATDFLPDAVLQEAQDALARTLAAGSNV